MDTAAGIERSPDGVSALTRARGGLKEAPPSEWRSPSRAQRPIERALFVRVLVCEEHEILRAGLVALLAREPSLAVAAVGPEQVNGRGADVAIVSGRAASRMRFDCPIVIVSEQPQRHHDEAPHNDVLAVLHRGSLTVSQLLGTIRTVAGMLQPRQRDASARPRFLPTTALRSPAVPELSKREHQVLRLLAEGEGTRGIAQRLNYSERTVKNIVHDLLVKLDCRTRAHAVALAARRGLI